LLLLAGAAKGNSSAQSTPAAKEKPRNTAPIKASDDAKTANPAQLFQLGQDALAHNRLDEAEHNFRGVLVIDPQSGGAYANLGVVYMQRKQ